MLIAKLTIKPSLREGRCNCRNDSDSDEDREADSRNGGEPNVETKSYLSSVNHQKSIAKCRDLNKKEIKLLNQLSTSSRIFMLVVQLLLLFLLANGVNSESIKYKHEIHKRMSEKDLRRVFQVESHDKVPEYDLVNIRVLSKRDAEQNDRKQIHLTAFGEKIQLNLKPNKEFNDRLTELKVLLAETTRTGKLKYIEDLANKQRNDEDIGKTYHDDETMAAVLINHNARGKMQLDGTIGHDLVIKPAPIELSSKNTKASKGVHDGHDDDELFLDEDEQQEVKRKFKQQQEKYAIPKLEKLRRTKEDEMNEKRKLNTHIVYRRKNTLDSQPILNLTRSFSSPPSSSSTPHSDYAELEFDSISRSPFLLNATENTSRYGHRRAKRQAPDQIWPEVLLVVDYDSYLLHGANSRDVKRYFISFWNGVDLRYKLLAQPTIRVSLAGMIVAKDRDATPYLERNRLRTPNADAVDAAGALTDMGKYLYREDRLPTYDLAVVITKLDMCRKRYENGRCNRGTAGFAYVGGACVVNKRLEKVNSVAIIEDSGGFSGIIVAAHEVGHLLGCVHDGSPPPSYLGGPGATRCPWEDGYIMSDLRHTERGFRWSSCSNEQFKHFLNGETATCLYNYPHENQLLPRVLPGTMLSLDEQCKRDRGTNACFKDARVCAQLFCFDSASGYCVSYRPAAEGSSCGDGQICRNGKCTAEIENIIPDYTHNTQTVVSRNSVISSRSDPPPTPPYRTTGLTRRVSDVQRYRSRSLTPKRSTTVTVITEPSSRAPVVSGECVDVVEKMNNGLTCSEFLERFKLRYCGHKYVIKNCCESHEKICNER